MRYHYMAVLLFILICAIAVNLGFKLRMGQRWRQLVKTQIAILIIYLSWDTWAIYRKSWFFDSHQILNLNLLHRIPIEEILFFILVPTMSVICYLALSKITRWNQKGNRDL